MKKITFLVLALTVTLVSCSSSDDDGMDLHEYAMTAKINGVTFQANNPFGTNEVSNTNIWAYYPLEDFILLQGRQGGVWGTPEINLWLKKTDMVVGTYHIGEETFETPPSHFIDLIDNSNQIYEHTKGGTIIITNVNTTTKIVEGTFEFTTVQELENPTAPIDFYITDGTFRYKYE